MKLALALASALAIPRSSASKVNGGGNEIVQLKPPSSAILVPIEQLQLPETTGEALMSTSSKEAPKKEKAETAAVSYGRPECPCIGFNNVEGTTMVLLGKSFENYPGDLGGRCEAWDDGRYPGDCEDGSPGKGQGWCAKPWCYVDPRRCNIEVLPTMSSYVPTARYHNAPLFWSYATCHKKGEVEDPGTFGSDGCRCVGFDNLAGSMKFDVGGQKVVFPGETGGTCEAWDMDNNPACAVKGKKPDFCEQKYCFVDPCSCSLKEPPKVSTYLFGSTMQGKTVFYSYETCGGKDMFTASRNKHACVIHESAEDCKKQSRCAWNGAKCLGKELVEAKVCGTAAFADGKGSEATEKSGVSASRPLAALLAFIAAVQCASIM
mmetsp:Transcript_69240/g.122493  ORF Transcript_69240/g.122493 Transcript_69240/m.122493 type:complete len:377 (-) Transcript_69240:62-1192(-)|eukprot:CAMPEP_0197623162 /NCGR_PEP_ID=MMETSP1338-20131121/3223_1 /TAXON_ID=43686 ORGANISM="Pelagodinium beii, Strain RCC1491" /NCGR_SAMPLE_ID=MMETSP1338 /ASSEMBLY_ACC=CAM_ASM_000754 /LENGTH=376 /DNA_ID=CAMNT_0043193043 /DNA_START=38 /DNA_END=1168 /DNA_ORIENTATION=+